METQDCNQAGQIFHVGEINTMSMNHHLLAKETTDSILAKFKSGSWVCCGNVGTNFHRVGCDSAFPSPDAAFYDDSEKLMVSFEFKPPTENKRGILTGLGQTIAYLRSSNISYLIVPRRLEDFDVGKFMDEVYSDQIKSQLPIGLIIYDNENPENVSLIHNIKPLSKKIEFKTTTSSRFWAKHQDMPIPLFHLLLHCYYMKKTKQITGDAFAYCWNNFLLPKEAILKLESVDVKDVSGKPIKTLSKRKNIMFFEKKINAVKKMTGTAKNTAIALLKKDADTQAVGDNYYNSLKKNFITFLKHLNLIDSTGNLTENGLKLHHLGLVNSPTSKIFKDYFLKTVLTTGHHLDLVVDIDKLCNEHRCKKTTKEIKEIMLNEYESKGMIKRNPSRVSGDKNSVEFLKYEFILWNSTGLIVKTSDKPTLSFDWEKIVEVCSLPDL